MNDWIISVLVIAVIAKCSSKLSRYIEALTRRSTRQPSAWYTVTVGLGVALSVLVVGAAIELPIALKACVAGSAASVFALVAQAMFGRPVQEN